MPPTVSPKVIRLLQLLALGFISILFVWGVVSWSQAQGKLCVPPDYDDSHSLVEGALRLSTFENSGIHGLISEYIAIPPHSFLHYYYTSLLFAIFGVHQSVPYWCNALLIFGVLLTFYKQLPSIPFAHKLCFVIAFLGIPISFHLVHDFRSEVTLSALLFMATGLIVEAAWNSNPLHQTSKSFIAALLLFVIAFAIKPAMFPYTAGILGLNSLVYVFAGIRLGRPRSILLWNLGLLWFLSPALLLLHFAFHYHQVLDYIHAVAFKSDYYKLHGTSIWSFHWLGGSGVWHLSALKTILAMIVAGTLLLDRMGRLKDMPPDTRWHSFVLLTLGAFAGVAINQVNNFFFGMTFQLLLVSTSLTALAYLYANPRLSWAPILATFVFLSYWFPVVFKLRFLVPALAITIILAFLWHHKRMPLAALPGIVASGIFALLCWQVTQIAPFNNYRYRTVEESGRDGLVWRQEGPKLVFEKIKPLWTPRHPPLVCVASRGWMDARTLSWEAILQGKPWRILNYEEMPGWQNQLVPDQADLFILPDEGISGQIMTESALSSRQAALLNELEKRQAPLLAIIPAPPGKQVRIYGRPPEIH